MRLTTPPPTHRCLSRTTAQSKIIQEYARSRFDSSVVVDDLLEFTAQLLDEREVKTIAAQIIESRKVENAEHSPEYYAAALRVFLGTLPQPVFAMLVGKGAVSEAGALVNPVKLSAEEQSLLNSATLIALAERGITTAFET